MWAECKNVVTAQFVPFPFCPCPNRPCPNCPVSKSSCPSSCPIRPRPNSSCPTRPHYLPERRQYPPTFIHEECPYVMEPSSNDSRVPSSTVMGIGVLTLGQWTLWSRQTQGWGIWGFYPRPKDSFGSRPST
ncbi:Hypothetical protein FKW44_013839 [Caligus rogercresseyi]|uniref:Uncharacterized protein n=1 Tax=Caligus rogercresseyi TaxID=217165 RepID=A0A7T8JYK0_CALRO|nr:Hypothetical protein FKW44_013839 [Caligus rogercresseyi]